MILRSRRVVTPSGMRAASIHIRGERIERVGDFEEKSDVDYGDLVIHIFSPKAREYYDLERLWRNAKALHVPPE